MSRALDEIKARRQRRNRQSYNEGERAQRGPDQGERRAPNFEGYRNERNENDGRINFNNYDQGFNKRRSAKEKARTVKQNPVSQPSADTPQTMSASTSNSGSSQNSNYSPIDTSASDATMSGFFAPDDSFAANRARLEGQINQNKELQKSYSNTGSIAQGAIDRAAQNAYIDPAALDARIAQRQQYNNAKSDVMRAQLFGDMGNFEADSWNDAKPAPEVEMPNYEDLYDKYSDFDKKKDDD